MLRLRERLDMHEQDDEVRDKRLKQANKKPETKQQQWVNLFKHNNSSKLKKHIMKFFLVEGHIDIAKQFAEEANIDPKQSIPFDNEVPKINEQAVSQRYEVVKLIKDGQIDEALEKIKTYQNGKMFDETVKNSGQTPSNKKQILFCLKSLKVINLIKEKKLHKAISQARKQLIPFTQNDTQVLFNPQQNKYLPRIEQIMSLLVYPNLDDCSNYYLTTSEYRCKIAKQVNILLLSSQNEAVQLSKNFNQNFSYDSISELMKLTKWIEKRLEKFLEFPKINLKSTQSDQMFLPFSAKEK